MRKHAEQFHLHLADPDVRRAAADELWAFSGDVALPGTNEALLWGHDAADVLPRLEKLNAHITAAHEAGFKAGQEAKAKEIDEACRSLLGPNRELRLKGIMAFTAVSLKVIGYVRTPLANGSGDTPSAAIIQAAESLDSTVADMATLKAFLETITEEDK